MFMESDSSLCEYLETSFVVRDEFIATFFSKMFILNNLDVIETPEALDT